MRGAEVLLVGGRPRAQQRRGRYPAQQRTRGTEGEEGDGNGILVVGGPRAQGRRRGPSRNEARKARKETGTWGVGSACGSRLRPPASRWSLSSGVGWQARFPCGAGGEEKDAFDLKRKNVSAKLDAVALFVNRLNNKGK